MNSIFLFLLSFVFADTMKRDIFYQQQYGVTVITSSNSYQQHILAHPNMELVPVQAYIPSIVLDIRYATKNNFMKKKIYPQARCFVVKGMIENLQHIQQQLAKDGLGLKIYDAYRPFSATIKMYKIFPNKVFVAPPQKGSRHNRACAIDVTLIDLKTKKELLMPTAYDAFTKNARPNAPIKNIMAKNNRDKLLAIMQGNRFSVTNSEWWHYDFDNFKQYPLLDISFVDLQKKL